MSELNRIGIAIEEDLLTEFDDFIRQRGYPSRSEAFRDLIRSALADEEQPSDDTQVIATVTLLYSHATRQLADRMTALQHQYHDTVVSSVHVHLDHDNCLEVIVLRGCSGDVRQVAEGLIAMKGVHHGQLVQARLN